MTKTQQELEEVNWQLALVVERLTKVWRACRTPNTKNIISKEFRAEVLVLKNRAHELMSQLATVVVPQEGETK